MNIKHGGDLLGFAKKYGKKPEDILDFSSNINPWGLPLSVREVYLESADELTTYPDPYAAPFCEVLAEHFNVPFENIIAGNGSQELLQTAFRVLLPGSVLLPQPCFGEYSRSAVMNGALVQALPLLPENGFEFSLDELCANLKSNQLLILGHPNNPTGTAFSPESLRFLLRQAAKQGVFVILDEAFVDWTPERSVAAHVLDFNNLLVLRSMTKFYALAGIRSGYALGSKKIIAAMKSEQGPWTCNRLAQKLSVAALRDEAYRRQTLRWFREEKIRFYQELQKIDGLKVFPSQANFFLLRMDVPANGLIDELGRKGIYVRAAENFGSLDGHYFRIALRLKEENDKFIEALQSKVTC